MAEASLLGCVMPFATRDMHRCGRTFGKPKKPLNGTLERSTTPQTLIRDIYKRLGGSRLVLAQYRRPRAPCWSLALVPPEDGHAALEAAIRSPLAGFEVIADAAPMTTHDVDVAPAPRVGSQPMGIVLDDESPFDPLPNAAPRGHRFPAFRSAS
jgi:hypothetical protein